MNITKTSNVCFCAQYGVNGINSPAEINKKYNEAIKKNNIALDEDLKEIERLQEEVEVLNEKKRSLETSKAMMYQALYKMNNDAIQKQISKLPKNYKITLNTLPQNASTLQMQTKYSAPILILSDTNNQTIDKYKDFYEFQYDKYGNLDTDDLSLWLKDYSGTI